MCWSKRTAHVTTSVLAALTLVAAAAPLGAQAHSRELSLSAGAMTFDASGTGTALTFAARVARPLVSRWLLVEGGLSYAELDEQFSLAATRTGVVEAQLQAQAPLARVRPYVGLGGGWLHYFNNAEGRRATPFTASVAAGVRVPVDQRLGVRGELRVRGWNWDPGFGASAAEFTGGLTFAF